MICVHRNLISNRLTYLVYAKSTGELISFGFSDRSVRSLVSAKRSANRRDQTKKRLHFLADLWSQSEFRTERNAERKTNIKSEIYELYFATAGSQQSNTQKRNTDRYKRKKTTTQY